MTTEALFTQGLGLVSPWRVVSSELKDGELHLRVEFERGSKFDGKPVHDTVEKSWRHLNFWQFPTYIHCKVPRVIDTDGKVTMEEVPWAAPGSGFTALFEAVVLLMAPQMPVLSIARLLKVDDMRLWRLLERLVRRGLERQDLSGVTRIALDETASRRGHNYITTVVDIDKRRVIFSCIGRSSESLKEFAEHLKSHGGQAQNISSATCDMSAAFQLGIKTYFPKAAITLDKFHLVKMVNEAVDTVRKAESRDAKFMRGTRLLWLKNPNNLTVKQEQLMEEVLQSSSYPKTIEAYRLRLIFQDIFNLRASQAEPALAAWVVGAYKSGIYAMKKVAQTFADNAHLILNWFKTRTSNGILEGFNSVLQSAKNKARGYANPKHMILMSYILHGKLDSATTHSK